MNTSGVFHKNMRLSKGAQVVWGVQLVLVSLLAILPTYASEFKNESSDMGALDLFAEEELLISATKHEQTLRKAPASVTVITEDNIRLMGARTITDVLRRIPGINVTRNLIGYYVIEVRSISSVHNQKIKLLIDGHSINNNALASPNYSFDIFPLNNVKRIEVLRGPVSALWGSDGIGAVINVITKQAVDMLHNSISVAAGLHHSGNVNLQYKNQFDDTRGIALQLDAFSTKGVKLGVESDALGNSGVTDDWDQRMDLALNLNYKQYVLRSRFVNRSRGGYIGVASALNDETVVDTKRYYVELEHNHEMDSENSSTQRVYVDYMDWRTHWEIFPEGTVLPSGSFPDGMIGIPSFKEEIVGAELRFDHKVDSSHLLTLGLQGEYRQQFHVGDEANFHPITLAPLPSVQNVESLGNWNREATRKIAAVYIQDIWYLSRDMEMTLGVRHDHYSDFGDTTNPRAALVWDFHRDWNLKLLYGSAFRAPSFEELYNQNNPAVEGNLNLRPEKIETYEVSLGHALSYNTDIRAALFYSDFSSKIELTPNPAGFKFNNTLGHEVTGLEFEVQYMLLENSSIYANYTYQDATLKVTGERLPDVARNKANVGVNIDLKHKLRANVNMLHVGQYPRATTDSRPELGNDALVDVALSRELFPYGVALKVLIKNVFDREYKDPARLNPSGGTVFSDYPRDGRTVWLEAEQKF